MYIARSDYAKMTKRTDSNEIADKGDPSRIAAVSLQNCIEKRVLDGMNHLWRSVELQNFYMYLIVM